MPFGRIDDGLFGHKKIRHLLSLKGGSAALGLWTVADSWCNKELTDGHVPAYMVSSLGPWSERDAELLVASRLWTKVDGGYQFHDWEDFNDTRRDVLEKRAKEANKKGNQRAAERAKKALARSRPSTLSPGDTLRDSPELSQECPLGCPAPPTSDTDTSLSTKENTPASATPRLVVVSEPKQDPVFAHWLTAMSKDPARTKLNAARKAKLKARRAEGYTDEQLCQAIDGCRLSPFHMGQNDRGEAYTDLATILRDGSTVEKHIERVTQKPRRDVRKGFCDPAPASAFTNPTDLDRIFGPEPKPAAGGNA